MLQLGIPTVWWSCNKQRDDLDEGGVSLSAKRKVKVNVSGFQTYDKEINAEITVMPECFFF